MHPCRISVRERHQCRQKVLGHGHWAATVQSHAREVCSRNRGHSKNTPKILECHKMPSVCSHYYRAPSSSTLQIRAPSKDRPAYEYAPVYSSGSVPDSTTTERAMKLLHRFLVLVGGPGISSFQVLVQREAAYSTRCNNYRWKRIDPSQRPLSCVTRGLLHKRVKYIARPSISRCMFANIFLFDPTQRFMMAPLCSSPRKEAVERNT